MTDDCFLENFEHVVRTRLFDSSWTMSSQWLEVTARPLPSAVAYGDVSCNVVSCSVVITTANLNVAVTVSLDQPSGTVIVLSQIDDRYFKGIDGRSIWSFNFLLFKKGESRHLAGSPCSRNCGRSVNLEIDLEAGEYVVEVSPLHTSFASSSLSSGSFGS